MKDIFRQAIRFPFLVFARILSAVWPSSSRHVAFGAWFGTLYADNPKYLLEYLAGKSELHIHWIGNEQERAVIPRLPNVDFSAKGTLKSFINILRSKYVVCSHSHFYDLSSLPLYHGKLCLNLWHGIPVKYFGKGIVAQTPCEEPKSVFRRWIDATYHWLYKFTDIATPVASKRMAELCAMQNSNNFGEFLPFGTPRNDFLIINRNNSSLKRELRKKYAEMLGFKAEKKIILYMPTYRASGKDVFAFYELHGTESDLLKSMLSRHNAVLIEKHHWMTYVQHPMPHQSNLSIVITKNQQSDVDVQELLLISDIIISDYSGAYIDFGLLERPCIHFTYDLEEYRNNDSGLAYDITKVAAGPIVRTLPELLSTLSKQLALPVFQPASHYKDLVEYETGHACEQLARFIGIEAVH